MLRAALTAVFAFVLTSCAHERSNDSRDPAVIAVTQFIIEATATDEGGYSWEAFGARVANSLTWRSPQASAVLEQDVRREGRITGRGGGQDVVVVGNRNGATSLTIDTDTFSHAALLESLRAAGADVEFQGDFESYTEYVLTPAGRDVSVLATNSTCIPFDPQPGEVCRNFVTLTFNPW